MPLLLPCVILILSCVLTSSKCSNVLNEVHNISSHSHKSDSGNKVTFLHKQALRIGEINLQVSWLKSNTVTISYTLIPNKVSLFVPQKSEPGRFKRKVDETLIEKAIFQFCIKFTVFLDSKAFNSPCNTLKANLIKLTPIHETVNVEAPVDDKDFGLKYTIVYHDSFRKDDQETHTVSAQVKEDAGKINFDDSKSDRILLYVAIGVVSSIAVLFTCIAILVVRRKRKKLQNKLGNDDKRQVAQSDSFTLSTMDRNGLNNSYISFPMTHYRSKEEGNKSETEPEIQVATTSVKDLFEVVNYSNPISLAEFRNVLTAMRKDSNFKILQEFLRIKELTESQIAVKTSSVTGMMSINRKKNRFTNILPYEHSRVKLSKSQDGSDYINASFIPGPNGNKHYIAAQAPLPSTVNDFWTMIIEQNVRVIVMLNMAVEGRGDKRCAPYWSSETTEKIDRDSLVEAERIQKLRVGEYSILLKSELNYGEFIVREFQVLSEGVLLSVKQYQVPHWADFDCPEDPESLFGLIRAVRRSLLDVDLNSPLLVHCSAGVGRTGTFIALDRIYHELMRKKPLTADVFGTVMALRQFRNHMVQSEDQYTFLYECTARLIELQSSAGTTFYENLQN